VGAEGRAGRGSPDGGLYTGDEVTSGGEAEGRDVEDEMYATGRPYQRSSFDDLHQGEPFDGRRERRPPRLERQADKRPPQWLESLADVAQSALHGVVRALAARAIDEIS